MTPFLGQMKCVVQADTGQTKSKFVYVCKDHRDQESDSIDFFIFSAVGHELSGSSLFRQVVFIPSVLWPPFSAPALLD